MPREERDREGAPLPAPEVDPHAQGADAAPLGESVLNRLRRVSPVGAREPGVGPAERDLLRTPLLAAPTPTKPDLDASAQRELAGLRSVLEVSLKLVSIDDTDVLLEEILDLAAQVSRAQRGMLLMREGKVLRPVKARDDGRNVDEDAAAFSDSLAQRCLATGAIQMYDASDAYANLRTKSMSLLNLQRAVCLPLRARDRILGVLYLDSRDQDFLPSGADLRVLEAFAAQAVVALLNAEKVGALQERHQVLEQRNEELLASLRDGNPFPDIVGKSVAMLRVFERVRLFRNAKLPVVILGESGTGKENVARALHGEITPTRPFVAVNCGGIAKDLFESAMFGHRRGSFSGASGDQIGFVDQAEGGTLFLDEIGDLPLSIQVKLNRLLDERAEFTRVGDTQPKRANVRMLFATHKDLLAMVKAGDFREDLYYRIMNAVITLPPLRDRLEDIPLLVQHFLKADQQETGKRPEISPSALRRLVEMPWPGNVRVLRGLVQTASALRGDTEVLESSHIDLALAMRSGSTPATAPEGGLQSLDEGMRIAERRLLVGALEAANWNVTRAATLLDISRQHLHNRVRVHSLERPRPRATSNSDE